MECYMKEADMSMLKQFVQLIRSFREDKSAVVVVIYVLVLVPILGTVALAVDYAMVTRSKTAVNAAADAATLAAVSDSFLKSNLDWNQQKIRSTEATQKTFEAILKEKNLTKKIKNVTYKVEIKNNMLSSSICYSAVEPAYIIIYAGIKEFPFEGCSTSVSAPPIYYDIVFLVDASGSMGLGATTADQNKMKSKLYCEFACHSFDWNSNLKTNCDVQVTLNDKGEVIAENGFYNSYSRTTQCVHLIGARTRFDVVKQSILSIVDFTKKNSRTNDQYRLTTYKYSNFLTNVHTATLDKDLAIQKITAMEQDVAGAGTNIVYSIEQMKSKLPKSGTGKSPDSRKVLYLIVTDGVQNNGYQVPNCGWNHAHAKQTNPSLPDCPIKKFYNTFFPKNDWIADPNYRNYTPYHENWRGGEWPVNRLQAIDPNICKTFKTPNAEVGIINMEYIFTDKRDPRYNAVNQIKDSVHATLAGCTTDKDNLYFRIKEGDDLINAMQKIIFYFVKKATITV